MITGPQMKAGRALLSMSQRGLAEASGLSLPTIQRMEACKGNVRANVESLVQVVDALRRAGVELIADGTPSQDGGRGARLTRG
ncbi:MAG: transcriptional regulator [Gammaproteobacteria bacterium]|nr:transcriptional regulator [Gammaproteobacteria bacterium]